MDVPRTIETNPDEVPMKPSYGELYVADLWLGVSVWDQESADRSVPSLLTIPAAKHIVIAEPMLGPVDLLAQHEPCCPSCYRHRTHPCERCGRIDGRAAVDWVICGGETGPEARPTHPDWVRGLRDQCQAAQVPFFFKGWGEWVVTYDRDRDDPEWRSIPQPCRNKEERFINMAGGRGFHGKRVCLVRRVGKSAAGRLLDGREWNEIPYGKVTP